VGEPLNSLSPGTPRTFRRLLAAVGRGKGDALAVLEGRAALITGSGRGIGRATAELLVEHGANVLVNDLDAEVAEQAASELGERAVAFAGNVAEPAVADALVARAVEAFGRLDIVVNNAGYGHFGMIEEITEDEARAQLETNLFGALWVTQAALPYLREQGSGHIIQVSSIGGISAFPLVGIYHASKWGLEGFTQALAQEVAGFGIHVTLVEPGAFSTDWAGSSSKRSAEHPAYAEVHRTTQENRAKRAGNPGDPEASREAILRVVDADEPPLRVFFGEAPLAIATADYEQRLRTWNEWQPVALVAQGGER
jgi:NAD(P)-dependent dehydrogenase (short-subunit alcohol dehydrogenase family)